MSTEKWLNPGDYGEKVESVALLKNCSDVFRKRVESVCVPKNNRIRVRTGKGGFRASIEKLFGGVPEKGPISVSPEK